MALALLAMVVTCWGLADAVHTHRYGWTAVFFLGFLGVCLAFAELARLDNLRYGD